MKRIIVIISSLVIGMNIAHALVISEIFSNPIGDDGGREWIEIYNDTEDAVDISSLSISIKGGVPVVATQVAGGTTLPAKGYAIIGSTVSGATKFLQDYPTYNGILMKASISLVNSGVTSIDIRILSLPVDTIASYTGAKEGFSYGRVGNTYAVVTPTPGSENSQSSSTETTSQFQTQGTQVTIPQMSPPSADIVVYLPHEKTVVAGAPTLFSVSALTNSGKHIDNIKYSWSFGDGGQGAGASTTYRYFYPGRYVLFVEATNGLIAGNARMLVKVVSPEVSLSPVKYSKYGPYIEINNPNAYELDVSTWKVSIDGAQYVFPLNTILLPGVTTISGASLGFASTSIGTSSVIRLLFPNNEEVAKVSLDYYQNTTQTVIATSSYKPPLSKMINENKKPYPVKRDQIPLKTNISEKAKKMATSTSVSKKDRKIAEFFYHWFNQ